MSDILSRAEDLAERYNSSGFIHKEATLLLPELIAEIKQQAAYVARLEAAYLAARRTIEWDAIDRDELNRHYTNISAPWMDAKTKGDLIEQRISKSLGWIKRGEQE